MEEQNVWHNIEGAIKNISTALQSLPEEFKAKALKLFGTQLNNSSEQKQSSPCNEKSVELKLENGEKNERLLGNCSSLIGSNSSVVAEASMTSLPSSEKKRKGRRTKVNSSEHIINFNVKKTLRSGMQRKVCCAEDNLLKRATRQTTKEAKKNRKKVSGNCLSASVNKIAKTDLTKHAEPISIKPEEENDNKPSLSGEISSSSDQQPHGQEMLSADITTDIVTSVLKSRKRGRPRKSDVSSSDIKLEEVDLKDDGTSGTKDHVTHKKPGRPRQSSYSSGYIPRAKSFRCLECGKMLATKQSFREHQRQHTGEGFICDSCGQKFTTSSGFMLHKRYHSDDPHMYKCSKCKYIVSSQQLLDDHYQLRHDPNRPKSHICDVCGKAFHGSTQLEKHLFSHSNTKPYACDQCGFSTAYPGGLEKHKYNVHVADRKLFRCELCGIQLKSKGTYIEHIGRHFNQRKKKCEICEKTFPNASQLAAHRRCHLEPTVPCEICGKKLRSKHKLKVHKLIHTGQKDFTCPYCAYVTYVKHNLKKHCLARHKVDYPPLLTQKMKKYSLNEVSSDGLKDPLALKCLRKLNSNREQPTEEGDASETATTAAPFEEPILDKTNLSNTSLGLIPMTKVEMITAGNEPKTFIADDKMYVTLSTIDRSAILDFHCPAGAFYPPNFYLPTLVNGDQQLT